MNQAFDPFALLMSHVPGGWNWFVVAGYVLSGTFAYLLAYEIVGSRLGALMAAFVYAMSGLIFIEANHVLIVHTVAFMPLMLLCVEKLAKRTSVGWLTVGSLCVGLAAVDGHIQVLLYALWLSGAYALYKLVTMKEQRLKTALAYFFMFAIGIGLGAIQILPTAELAYLSIHEKYSFEEFSAVAIQPLQLVGALFPYFLGSPNSSFFGMRYFGPQLGYPLMCYIGLLPLLIFPFSLLLLRRGSSLFFWFCATILTLLISLCKFTPLAVIFFHIPPFGSMNSHYKVFFLTSLAAGICCAYVIRSFEKGEIHKKWLTRVLAVESGLFVGAVFSIGEFSSLLDSRAATFSHSHVTFSLLGNPALASQMILVVFSTVAFLAWRAHPSSRVFSTLMILVLAADLAFQGWFCDWRAQVVAREYLTAPEHALSFSALLNANHQRLLPVRGASGTVDELPPCISRNWNLPSASGYSPIMLKRYSNLTTITKGGFLLPPWRFTAKDKTFDILSIKYLFTERGDRRLLALNGGKEPPRFKMLEPVGEADVFENLHAMPRCWIAAGSVVLRPDEIIRTIQNAQLPDGTAFAPESVALLEENAPEAAAMPASTVESHGPSMPGVATIRTLQNEKVVIETSTSQPGILILSDTYYPGWQATVDDRPAGIHQTDYVLQSVFVPAGKHVVTFVYRPTSLLYGIIACAAAALMLLSINLFYYARRRRSRW